MFSRHIFVIVLFFNAVILHSQIPSIDVEIYDIHITKSSISFKYAIRNRYETPIWFHKYGSFRRIEIIDDTIFFAPVNNHATRWETTHRWNINTIEINSNDVISGYYFEEYLRNGWWRYDDNVKVIDLTFVFTTVNVVNPISDARYRSFLEENMILVNRIFRITNVKKK